MSRISRVEIGQMDNVIKYLETTQEMLRNLNEYAHVQSIFNTSQTVFNFLMLVFVFNLVRSIKKIEQHGQNKRK